MNDRPDQANVTRFGDECVLNTDTVTQATVLARKALQAYARESANEAFSSANKNKVEVFFPLESKSDGTIPLPSSKSDVIAPVSTNPSAQRNLDLTEITLPGYSDQFDELVTSSCSNGLPLTGNKDALDFIKSIDDLNTNLDDKRTQCKVNNQTANDKLEAVQYGTNSSATGNEIWNSLRNLETYGQISSGVPFEDTNLLPTLGEIANADEFLQDMLPEDVAFQGPNAKLTSSVENVALNKTDDCQPHIMDRKSARDRRRAIARRRTLLKRREEAQLRMRKLVNDLSKLPEAERVRELSKLKNEAREREEQRRAKQRLVSSRQAVQRCRGKAGSTTQELEGHLRRLQIENKKLKRVVVFLAQSGCITDEEFRKHGVIVNNAMSHRCSLSTDARPSSLQTVAEQWH